MTAPYVTPGLVDTHANLPTAAALNDIVIVADDDGTGNAAVYRGDGAAWLPVLTPQSGSTTLVSGVSPFIACNLGDQSTITATLRHWNGAAGVIAALSPDRIIQTLAGGGGFKLTSVNPITGAPVATDLGTYDWHMMGLGLMVPPPFSPLDVGSGTINLWLRADLGITESAGTVSDWADQSGAGNTISQAASGKQPALLATDANGQPSLQFVSGNSQNLLRGAVDLFGTGAYTIFVVAKADALGSATVWLANSNGGVGVGLLATAGTQYNVLHYAVADHIGGTPTTAAYEIQEVIRGAGAAPTLKINGTNVPIGASAANQNVGPANLCVGGLNGTTQFYSGKLAEIIVYASALSVGDATAVRNYLSARYSI